MIILRMKQQDKEKAPHYLSISKLIDNPPTLSFLSYVSRQGTIFVKLKTQFLHRLDDIVKF